MSNKFLYKPIEAKGTHDAASALRIKKIFSPFFFNAFEIGHYHREYERTVSNKKSRENVSKPYG